MTTILDQSKITDGLKCPVCAGPVVAVWWSDNTWAIECLANDFDEFEECDVSPACNFRAVLGNTMENAANNFKSQSCSGDYKL